MDGNRLDLAFLQRQIQSRRCPRERQNTYYVKTDRTLSGKTVPPGTRFHRSTTAKSKRLKLSGTNTFQRPAFRPAHSGGPKTAIADTSTPQNAAPASRSAPAAELRAFGETQNQTALNFQKEDKANGGSLVHHTTHRRSANPAARQVVPRRFHQRLAGNRPGFSRPNGGRRVTTFYDHIGHGAAGRRPHIPRQRGTHRKTRCTAAAHLLQRGLHRRSRRFCKMSVGDGNPAISENAGAQTPRTQGHQVPQPVNLESRVRRDKGAELLRRRAPPS